MARLRVATSQLPVSAEVAENERWIVRQIRQAAERGARIAHFPEAALSGYAGYDHLTWSEFDWDGLRVATERIMAVAAEVGIWVVLGSAHELADGHLPHNSVYVIDDRGRIVDRYDKRYCSGDADGTTGDLSHYSPGDHRTVWEVDGVRCGALVCYEVRFPELHRELAGDGVELIFHSFYAANVPAERMEAIRAVIGPDLAAHNQGPTFTHPGLVMPASIVATAAADHIWVSVSNSSARESLFPAFVVRADGVAAGRLRRNVPGVLVIEVDTEADLYDSTNAWRHAAMDGAAHTGTIVADPRSADRTTL